MYGTCTVHCTVKGGKTMIIAEFCKGRLVDSQAIRKYINRHQELFDGHTTKNGKEIELDDVAVGILEKKYPFPVNVQDGVSFEEHGKTLKQLAEAQQAIILLQEEIRKQTVLIADAEAKQLLLEDREKQLKETKEELTETKEQVEELKTENDRLKNRTFWDYLLRKN